MSFLWLTLSGVVLVMGIASALRDRVRANHATAARKALLRAQLDEVHDRIARLMRERR